MKKSFYEYLLLYNRTRNESNLEKILCYNTTVSSYNSYQELKKSTYICLSTVLGLLETKIIYNT